MMTPRSPLAVGAAVLMTADARRMTLNVPPRLTWMTRMNASSACGPFLPSTFSARTMPAALIDPAQRSELGRHCQPVPNARFVGDVDARESRVAAKLGGEPRRRPLR